MFSLRIHVMSVLTSWPCFESEFELVLDVNNLAE